MFGPVSPSPTRLKSWAGTSGTAVTPSVIANSDTSGPSRNSSTTTAPPGRARHAAGVFEGDLAVVGHDHALATGQAVVLDDVRGAELVERVLDLSEVVHRWAMAVGTPASAMTCLANALDPSRAAASGRAEAVDPGRPHGVSDPGDQRCLGADHDQVHAEGAGQANDVIRIDGVHGVVGAHLGRARVPGGDVQGAHSRVSGQRQGQGVLAPARSDHEESTQAGYPAGVRPGDDQHCSVGIGPPCSPAPPPRSAAGSPHRLRGPARPPAPGAQPS